MACVDHFLKEDFFSAHRQNVDYICTKFPENRYKSYRADTIFIRKISKGHNSVKMETELRFFFSAYRLIMVIFLQNFMK